MKPVASPLPLIDPWADPRIRKFYGREPAFWPCLPPAGRALVATHAIKLINQQPHVERRDADRLSHPLWERTRGLSIRAGLTVEQALAQEGAAAGQLMASVLFQLIEAGDVEGTLRAYADVLAKLRGQSNGAAR